MKTLMKKALGMLAYVSGAAVLGLLSVVVPPHVSGHLERGGDPYALIPFIDKGIRNMETLPSALFLLITGLILGYSRPAWWFLWGPCAVTLFPIYAMIDMVNRPHSHNLWPFEFVMYGVFSLPAILGSFIGFLARRLSARRMATQPEIKQDCRHQNDPI